MNGMALITFWLCGWVCLWPQASLADSEFDDPLGLGSGGGQLFGTTGGVMEAALRTVYEVVSGQPMGRIKFEVSSVLERASVCLPLARSHMHCSMALHG